VHYIKAKLGKASDIVLEKVMKFLYTNLSQTALGTIVNDAKSCLDRSICSLSMHINRYDGAPNFCWQRANILENTISRLKTALGDSENSYSHCEDYPIHGMASRELCLPSNLAADWQLPNDPSSKRCQRYGYS
jgi:hypothetical protein